MDLHKIVNVKFGLMIKYNYTPAKAQRGKKKPAGFDLLQQTARSSACSSPAVPPKSLSEGRRGTGLQEAEGGDTQQCHTAILAQVQPQTAQQEMLHRKVQLPLPVGTHNFQEKANI